MAWELHIIENDSIQNAFCTPGGFIYVYTGLLNFVESEDELAGIIAHEVAHGDLRHSTDQLTKQYGIQVLIALLTDSDTRLLADIGANLVQLSYSRGDETEADQYAVRYLKDTPYNPTAFADFFQRMLEKDGDTGMFQFLSTHPDPGNRVEKIKEEANAN
jgi:predicted Zn-dependent protease